MLQMSGERMSWLADTIRRHKSGDTVGVYSVCSAHPTVVEAAIMQAGADDVPVLIEATSNQVDQFGATPDASGRVPRPPSSASPTGADFPRSRVVLGGDHLGPNRWQGETAAAAMEKADATHRRLRRAGYSKIYLDAACPVPTTRQCSMTRPSRSAPHACCTSRRIRATQRRRPSDVRHRHRGTGSRAGPRDARRSHPDAGRSCRATDRRASGRVHPIRLDHVWPRVMALVVQPGVEFDHLQVIDYRRTAHRGATARPRHGTAPGVRGAFHRLSATPQIARARRRSLAVLKVGPGLTFAMREALFGLAHIENQLPAAAVAVRPDRGRRTTNARQSRVLAGLLRPGSADQQTAGGTATATGSRYTGPTTRSTPARRQLLDNSTGSASHCRESANSSPSVRPRPRRRTGPDRNALVIDRIRDAMRPYARACRTENNTTGDHR